MEQRQRQRTRGTVLRYGLYNQNATEVANIRSQILHEIRRMMQQDTFTKEVFREMDGFLSLMSVLASFGPEDDVECIRTVFAVLIEAMHNSQENEIYFRVRACLMSP